MSCRLSGTPCIVRAETNGLRPRARWKRWLHARLLSQYAACLGIGVNNRRYLVEAGIPEKRLFSTPYCIDNQQFSDAADAARQNAGREELRKRFGLDPDRTTLLFSGKFVEKKRPGDIIEALRRLPEAEQARLQVLMLQQPQPRDFVIATGRSHSLRRFVELAFAQVGLDWRDHVDIDAGLGRPTDIAHSSGSPARAREVLGWNPQYGLEDVIRFMVAAEQGRDWPVLA